MPRPRMSKADAKLLALIRQRLDLSVSPLCGLSTKRKIENIMTFKTRVANLIFTLPDPSDLFKGVTVGKEPR